MSGPGRFREEVETVHRERMSLRVGWCVVLRRPHLSRELSGEDLERSGSRIFNVEETSAKALGQEAVGMFRDAGS